MTDLIAKKDSDLITGKVKLCNLAQEILVKAKNSGATSAEVYIGVDSGLTTTVRKQEVETIEFHRDKSIGITIYNGHKKGNVAISDITQIAIDEAIAAAMKIATYTETDECNGLADPNLMAKNLPDLDLYHPNNITSNEAIELAKECESAALNSSSKISNSEGATFAKTNKLSVYANSHGFVGAVPSSSYSMSCVVIAKDDNTMHRDYDYTIARNYNELQNFAAVGKSAALKTINRMGARKISTCKVPVIFSAKLAPSLIGCFISAISGGNLYRKTSFLLDSLEQQVFPDFITLEENPFVKKGLGSTSFDAEGVATKQKNIVTDGVVKSYVLGSYSARKLKLTTTGNAGGVHNLLVKSTNDNKQDDLAKLLKTMGKGILITELMGHGVNLVTGDYSRGAFGYWVENGEIQFPVHEITIASNLKNMFANIVAIGNDLEIRTNIRSGSILLQEMTIAGN